MDKEKEIELKYYTEENLNCFHMKIGNPDIISTMSFDNYYDITIHHISLKNLKTMQEQLDDIVEQCIENEILNIGSINNE